MTSTLAGFDGINLAYDAWGAEDAPPLLLLHGGGQTRGSWSAAGPRLAERGWRVLAVDHRGHGESDWSPDGIYGHVRIGRDIEALARAQHTAPVLVGASLGGLGSLLAAGEFGAPARGVVLVDVAHRVHMPGVNRIVDFMTDRPDGFASVEEAAEAVAAYLPNRPPPNDLDGLRRNLRERDGRLHWHWDPRMLEDAVQDREDVENGERYLSAARNIPCPVLVVRGGMSDVLSEEIAGEFVREVPGSELVEVPAAEHMVAGDRNDRFIASLLPFLDAL